MFKLSCAFIPIAVRNTVVVSKKELGFTTYKGLTDIYIFGIRIISIHRTKPWENYE